MQFRTVVTAPKTQQHISYTTPILLLGSCFAENIGRRLEEAKFEVVVNPFGILYNPISVAKVLERLANNTPFSTDELYLYEDIWLSFEHHGRFSSPDKALALNLINSEYEAGVALLRRARFLSITLGTAYYYSRSDTGAVVSNCHKLPSDFFVRKIANIDQICDTLGAVLQKIKTINPDIQYIFTLSPIRHWKDGAVDNHYSKSVLMVAIQTLRARLGSSAAAYFPAYELMMDDLRDYRFYEADMLHPNPTAISYIWTRFKEAYLDGNPETLQLMAQVEKIKTAMQHRPRQTQSEAHKRFRLQQLQLIEVLAARYPFMDWSFEKLFFSDV